MLTCLGVGEASDPVTITATSTDRPEVSSSVRLTITGGTVTVDLNGNTGQNEAE